MTMLKYVAASVALIVLLVGAWLVARRAAPPVRIVQSANGTTVDVSTLGEYPTTVRTVRLSELGTGKIVWELDSGNAVAQLHSFTLREGDNPANIDAAYGKYAVVVPAGLPSFTLGKTEYKVEVWGTGNVLSRTSRTLQLGAPW